MSQKGDVKERVLKKVAQPGLSRPSSVRDGLIHPAFALPKRLPTTSWSRRFYLSGRANKFAPLPNKNAPRYRERRLLPNLDSNQDTQIQNLPYYLYTIGQCPMPWANGRAKLGNFRLILPKYGKAIFSGPGPPRPPGSSGRPPARNRARHSRRASRPRSRASHPRRGG